MSQFAPMQTGFAAEPLYSLEGAAALGQTSVDGNLNVSGVANIAGPAFVRGDIEGRNGALYISNDTGTSEAFIDLRAGASNQLVVVPTFSIIGNANPAQTPSLFMSRTNMTNFPVPNAIMLTAYPNNTTEFPTSINVNGVITAKFQASVKTAGTNAAAPPRSNYTGYPIYILNSPGANGYYDIVLKSIPASGGVICVLYDNNTAASFTQTIRLFASNGTTGLGNVNTDGKRQNHVIAGTYTAGQPQTIYGILTPLVDFNTLVIPAAEADALHAATEQERGFNKLL